ncbi:DUF4254 domain-containing protein [Nocardia stercoris]|uniref:DUF4254 domain-containing protein n=1 Tax=Nocardia stercoris TaxID=2483361 RepID=A0A3M2KZX1_9NOCA|nr:DUF4254 domain-containing protein [Nocardia stercoris]RMI31019.1 DUF4254 domain-containing protein [Nocardia stercoris]
MESLPPKDLLLDACRGTLHGDQFVLRCAARLTELHERRLAAPDSTRSVDNERAELVHDIDRWVAAESPPADGATRMHTETVGTVIDRMAQFSSLAYYTLANLPQWMTHDAWRRLTELAVAYEDLASEVATGRCRLPDLSGHREP